MKDSKVLVLKKDQERIAFIYTLFMHGEMLSTSELAEKVGCTVRTIQTDIKPHVEQGVLQKSGHKYFMPKEMRSDEIIKQAEMNTSMMDALLSKVFPSLETSHLFAQHPKNAHCFYFDFVLEEICSESLVANIVVALSQHIAVTFDYSTKDGVKQEKTVYPLKIANFDGNWYLIAYDLVVDKLKTYHLKEMYDLEVEQDDYLGSKRKELEKEADLIHSPWYNKSPKEVTLRVTDIAIEYIKRKPSPNMTIAKETEDTLVLKMTYYNSKEVMQFVKKWLPFVSIMDNEELNNELQVILEKALEVSNECVTNSVTTSDLS